MELVDIGVNLLNHAFDDDRDAVIRRAFDAGVTRLLVTGTSVAVSRAAAELAGRAPGLYATAGVHPHDAVGWGADSSAALGQLATHPRVVAIGETGLDFNRNYSSRADQERAFHEQLALAAQVRLPVFLHERDAFATQVRILEGYLPELCGAVAHCFTGTAEELDGYLGLGCHIGITGWLCDERRGLQLRDLIGRIPIDRLLLETDAPYLLPRSIKPRPRSRRNEPANLLHVLQAVSECSGRPAAEIAARTTANAIRIFRLNGNEFPAGCQGDRGHLKPG